MIINIIEINQKVEEINKTKCLFGKVNKSDGLPDTLAKKNIN